MVPRSGYKHFGAAKILPEGGFIPPEDLNLPWGPRQSKLCRGEQVRVPISELKSWLEEKLAY